MHPKQTHCLHTRRIIGDAPPNHRLVPDSVHIYPVDTSVPRIGIAAHPASLLRVLVEDH